MSREQELFVEMERSTAEGDSCRYYAAYVELRALREKSCRKASEISKAELVWMIARLRGLLYDFLFGPENVNRSEADELLRFTAFEDDVGGIRSGGKGER